LQAQNAPGNARLRFKAAKLNGIKPSAWLNDTLKKLLVWTMRRIDELLPINPAA
jgi:hypothetical protein